MILDILDTKGNKTEQFSLNDAVFNITQNDMAVAQYVRVYANNQRQGTSSTKTRGEVSGGGKKPWKQKGTGRARVGSSRNPIWRHGGVAHGPKPKDWSLNISKKLRNLAFLSVLSSKAQEKKILVVDSINMETPKTKEALAIVKNLDIVGKILFVTNGFNENFLKSVNNVPNFRSVLVSDLNTYDVLSCDYVVFIKDAVLNLQDKYVKTK